MHRCKSFHSYAVRLPVKIDGKPADVMVWRCDACGDCRWDYTSHAGVVPALASGDGHAQGWLLDLAEKLRAQRAELRLQVRGLVEALLKCSAYAQHRHGCASDAGGITAVPCDCGYVEAIEAGIDAAAKARL